MSHRLLLAIFPVIMLASPAMAQQSFHLDWDHEVSFRKYQTYVWAPRVAQQVASSPDYARVRDSIGHYLASRGFRHAAHGDFAIGFKVTPGTGGNYEGSYQRGGRSAGSLAIDIYDTTSKQPVWHADVSASRENLDAAVKTLLNRFPPSHGCSHNPAHTLIEPCPRDY